MGEPTRPPGYRGEQKMTNADDYDHDTWLEVQFDFVALPEGKELPSLAALAGIK